VWAASALGLLTATGALAGSCDCGGATGDALDASTAARDATALPDASITHDAGPPDADADASPPPDAAPPDPGWHRWALTPADCDVMVPDDLTKVDPVPWEPCPFMKDGCERATAPWAAKVGWGYGGSLFAAEGKGSTYLSVIRVIPGGAEILLLRDKAIIGAWRERTPSDIDPQCMVGGGARLRRGGTATIVVRRLSSPKTPDVFFGAADQLMMSPKHVVIDAKVPVGLVADTSDDTIALSLLYDRFAVHDLATGLTELPAPAQKYYQLINPTPVQGGVIYPVYTGAINSVWVRNAPGSSIPLLRGDTTSYDWYDTDGVDLVYDRSTGFIDEGTYETVEVFASPVATDPAKLVPKKIFAMPAKSVVPALCVGEGWVSVGTNDAGIYLIRIADGLKRKLPVVPGLLLHDLPRGGVSIAAGRAWLYASLDPGAANDMRYILSFEIDKLPLAP
jgi:hypothetical protein